MQGLLSTACLECLYSSCPMGPAVKPLTLWRKTVCTCRFQSYTIDECPTFSRSAPSRAAQLRRYAPEVANAYEDAAAELEKSLQVTGADLLTLQAAARESGYSADHLGRLIRSGRLTNHGREHAPKVKRCELPRKPAKVRPIASGTKGPNMEALTREAIASTRRTA
jgi:hypothetical protein